MREERRFRGQVGGACEEEKRTGYFEGELAVCHAPEQHERCVVDVDARDPICDRVVSEEVPEQIGELGER